METDEVKQITLNFYKELGGNPAELYFAPDWFNGATYKINRMGHGAIDIRRLHMDDYLDSKDETAEGKIKGKLGELLRK